MLRLRDGQWERIREHFPEEHIPDSRPSKQGPLLSNPLRLPWENPELSPMEQVRPERDSMLIANGALRGHAVKFLGRQESVRSQSQHLSLTRQWKTEKGERTISSHEKSSDVNRISK